MFSYFTVKIDLVDSDENTDTMNSTSNSANTSKHSLQQFFYMSKRVKSLHKIMQLVYSYKR